MSNQTTPFSWQMPTATDLVTDLPADFEVFGQAVATSMADLLGGTTGQILAKNSNTDMDFVWVANDQGDITAVTAGTGISGGGTSGAVTITNDMATTITASGDIVVGTGSGTYDNLPIGTTGQVLTADTTVSPYKVKWAAAASGNTNPAFTAYRATSNQTFTSAVNTKIAYNAEDFDTNNNFDSTTNYRFTPTTAGYYLISASMTYGGTLTRVQLKLFKNGSILNRFIDTNGADNTGIYNGTSLVYANGTTDYFEMYGEFTGTSPVIFAGLEYNYFNGVWVRS